MVKIKQEHIIVSKQTKDKIEELKIIPRETSDSVIRRLITESGTEILESNRTLYDSVKNI